MLFSVDLSIICLLRSVLFFVIVVVNCGAKKQSPSTGISTPQQQTMPKPLEPSKPNEKKGEEEADNKPIDGDKKTETEPLTKENTEDLLDALKPKALEANRAKDIGDEKVANKGDYKTMAILDSPALVDDVSINDMGKDKQKAK